MNQLIPTQAEYSIMARQAKHLVESGLLPMTINTPQKAIAIITLGRELNIPAWQAINGIHVVQGKPTVSPQLMLALIERSGKLKNIKIDAQDTACTVTMERENRSPHTVTFSIQDAQKMGLTGKDNWKKQPKTMLQWRAISACARVCFPDVICGLYLTEELAPDSQYSEAGEIVDAESREVSPIEKPPVSAPVPQLPAPISEDAPEPQSEPEATIIEPEKVPELIVPEDAISDADIYKPWEAFRKKNYDKEEAEPILRMLYSRFSITFPDGSSIPKTSTKQLTNKELGFVLSAISNYPTKEKKPSARKKPIKNEQPFEKIVEEVAKTGKISLRAKVALREEAQKRLPEESSKSIVTLINSLGETSQAEYIEIANGLLQREKA